MYWMQLATVVAEQYSHSSSVEWHLISSKLVSRCMHTYTYIYIDMDIHSCVPFGSSLCCGVSCLIGSSMRKGGCSQQHGAASVLLPTDYARTDAIRNACAIASSEKTWVAKATALSVGSLALSWELRGLVEIVYHICV
jgi:hypothetical protein